MIVPVKAPRCFTLMTGRSTIGTEVVWLPLSRTSASVMSPPDAGVSTRAETVFVSPGASFTLGVLAGVSTALPKLASSSTEPV